MITSVLRTDPANTGYTQDKKLSSCQPSQAQRSLSFALITSDTDSNSGCTDLEKKKIFWMLLPFVQSPATAADIDFSGKMSTITACKQKLKTGPEGIKHMKTPILIAVCLLIVGMLPGQKISQPKTIYYGQVLTEGELNIVVGAKGIMVNNTSDNATYVVNLTYEKCYAINPATAVYACDYGKILFKDTTSKKVVLRLELPNGEVKKFILCPKESPPQVMLDGGQLHGVFRAAFFNVVFV